MQIIKEIRELEQIIEQLERVELQQKEDVEEDVELSICEPECGPLLFESDEELEELNHMNDSEELEDLITEASNETRRSCIFKTNDLFTIAGLEEDRQSFKVVKNIKEYLPEDESFEVEYDKETEKELVRYSGQVMKDVTETDDEKERLNDSLKSSLSLNQHTDMLTKEERLEEHIEVLPKEEEVQRCYETSSRKDRKYRSTP